MDGGQVAGSALAICPQVRGPVYSGPRIAFECPGLQLLVRIFREFRLEAASKWVLSSVGRAAPLQGVGHRFDPCSTHQKLRYALRTKPAHVMVAGFLFWVLFFID